MDEIELLRLRAKAKASAMNVNADEAPSAKEEDPSLWEDIKSGGMKALDMASRTLDMPSGAARVAWTGLEDIPALTGMVDREPTGKYPEDIYRAAQGKAPTSEEYMERQGIAPGAARTIGGIAKDIALDPLTYMTLGGSSLVKKEIDVLKKSLNPGALKAVESTKTPGALQKATNWAGEKAYKSGLKAVDLEAAKYGKEPVSEVLMREGVTGSAEEIQKRMDDLAETYKRERDYILKKSDESGGKVSMREAMAPLKEKISKIRESRDPNLQGIADVMEKDLDQYIKLETKADPLLGTVEKSVTPTEASGYKSSTYNQLPDSAYSQAKRTPVGSSLDKTKAFGLKEAVEKAVEKTSGKQSAEELKDLNDKLGRLLTTGDIAEKEAAKEIKKNAITQVDAMALAVDPKAFIAKQAAKALSMTGPRTKIGKGLMDRAKTDMLLEKNLLYTPWINMERQSNKDKK